MSKTTHGLSKSSSQQQPLTTPQQTKRVKVTMACTICRKKKVKCDGIQPCCMRCKSSGQPCEYTDPPRKRGPPKGYVEVIENRAHRIESLLSKEAHCNSVWSTCPTASSNEPVSETRDDIVKTEDISETPVSTQPVGEFSSSAVNTILNLVTGAANDTLNTKQAVDSSVPGQAGSNGNQYDFMTSDTVPQSTATLWADNFFAYFNLFFPILSRPHFMHQLVTQPQKMDPLLRNAVFAIGSHYTKHVHETDCVSRQFFNQCRSMLHLSSGKPTLSSLQALVIMCWYSYLQDDMQTCSELRLTLIACLRELNLGCDPGTSLDTVNVELRRRAFWTSYVIDQWLTVCTGHRLMSLRREKWDCKWPQLEDSQLYALDSRKLKWEGHAWSSTACHDISAEAALQVTAFSQMIKLAQIMGDSHERLYANPPVSFTAHQQPLEAALTEWLLNLPSYLEYGKSDDDTPPSPMAKIYRILYYTVQIMLHRPSFDHPNDFSRSICMTAANTIIHVAEQMHWHDQVRYLYNTFNTSLSLATSIHLDAVLHAGFDNVPARINLAKSVRLLKDTNCTLLPQPEFEHLLDHFLTDRCGIILEQQTLSTIPAYVKNLKRASTFHPDESSPKRRSIPFDHESPSSSISSTSSISEIDLDRFFNENTILSDLLYAQMTPTDPNFFQAFDPLPNDWLGHPSDLMNIMENPSSTYTLTPSAESFTSSLSPDSSFSPSQSPVVASLPKKEDYSKLLTDPAVIEVYSAAEQFLFGACL